MTVSLRIVITDCSTPNNCLTTVSAALQELFDAQRAADDDCSELDLYSGNSSLYQEYLQHAEKALEMETRIDLLKEAVETIRQTRVQSAAIANREKQGLAELFELRDAALSDALIRMRLAEGAFLKVSSVSLLLIMYAC